MTITVPEAPPLATVRSVALIHTGSWNAMTGVATFNTDDLAAAVAALDCPAVRRPILKFGHDGNHGAGEPALGWVDNMAVVDNGRTLVGDYVGMPGWLAGTNDDGTSVLASAYPDRSIEGEWDFRCQIGHLHPFVVHAVSLLGVERPAVGTLPSLQDLAVLYGVNLAEPPQSTGTAVTVHTSRETAMPNPQPTTVAAGVTTEDVRRQYYDDAPWSYWITEFHLEPLQLIVVDDNTGKHFRVPVSVTGEDTFAFGEPVEVLVRYVDATADTVAATAPSRRLVFASRAESRPGTASQATADRGDVGEPEPAPPVVVPNPQPDPAAPDDAPTGAPATPAAEPDPSNEEDTMSLSTEVRQRLGLGDDVTDDAAILAALDARLQPGEPDGDPTDDDEVQPEPEPAAQPVVAATPTPRLPDGVVAVDAATLAELRRNATLGAQAAERMRVEDRDRVISAAIGDGKIAPARRDHWVKAWEADPDGTRDVLASLESGLVVPVQAAAGHTGSGEETADALGVSDNEAADWAKQLGISAEELTRG